MKVKITTRLVGDLKSKVKPYELLDRDLPGFLIRVQPSGYKFFYAA